MIFQNDVQGFLHLTVFLFFYQSSDQKRKFDASVDDQSSRDVKCRRLDSAEPIANANNSCVGIRRSSRKRESHNDRRFFVSSSQTLKDFKLKVEKTDFRVFTAFNQLLEAY